MKTFLLKIVSLFGLFPLFNRYTRNTATVFMMHGFAPAGEEREGALSTPTLIRYFEYLRKNGYTVLSLQDYVKALTRHENTYKAVVFTIDDGYRDFYLHAFSAFRDFGYPATIFLTTDFIEKKLFFWWDAIEYALTATARTEIDLGFMNSGITAISDLPQKSEAISKITRYCKTIANEKKLQLIDNLAAELAVDLSGQPKGIYEPLSWSEIEEMSKCGIDFHPHTKTHPIISRVSSKQEMEEITDPKRLIESKLGKEANIFCYPNGQRDDFDDETIAALKSAGYIAAVTGIAGFNNTKTDNDMFRLLRLAIPEEPIMFKQYICGLELLKRRLLG